MGPREKEKVIPGVHIVDLGIPVPHTGLLPPHRSPLPSCPGPGVFWQDQVN